MEKLSRRAFASEFKIEAVKWVAENGLSYAAVRRLDEIPKLTKVWEGAYRTRKLMGTPRLRVKVEQKELSKLRKEVQELKMERDIFKKTAASRGVSFGHTLRGRASGASPEIQKIGWFWGDESGFAFDWHRKRVCWKNKRVSRI